MIFCWCFAYDAYDTYADSYDDAMYLLHVIVHYDTIIAMNDIILISNKEYFNLIP